MMRLALQPALLSAVALVNVATTGFVLRSAPASAGPATAPTVTDLSLPVDHELHFSIRHARMLLSGIKFGVTWIPARNMRE